jgi:hypothetical protein
LYYNSDIQIGGNLKIDCSICGSINHIFVHTDIAHCWECYFCSQRFWLDKLARDEYIIVEGVDEHLAEQHLQDWYSNVKCLYGHYEIYQEEET